MKSACYKSPTPRGSICLSEAAGTAFSRNRDASSLTDRSLGGGGGAGNGDATRDVKLSTLVELLLGGATYLLGGCRRGSSLAKSRRNSRLAEGCVRGVVAQGLLEIKGSACMRFGVCTVAATREWRGWAVSTESPQADKPSRSTSSPPTSLDDCDTERPLISFANAVICVLNVRLNSRERCCCVGRQLSPHRLPCRCQSWTERR